MKNYIIQFIFVLVLVLNPIYFTKSSNNEEIIADYSLLEKERMISEIDKEYMIFYTELFEYDTNISIKSNYHNIDFIINLSDYAMDSKALPSISIAQAILETGYGRSNKLKYNIFGIKGKGIKTKTKEFYKNRFVTINSEFQKFNNYSEAFDRHFEIIGKYNFQNRDYKHWAHTIKESGYATDPRYAEKLIYIIEKYNLSRLDRIQYLKENLYWSKSVIYNGIS